MEITIKTEYNIGDKVFAINENEDTIAEGVIVAIHCARYIHTLSCTSVKYTIKYGGTEKEYYDWCVFGKFEDAQEFLCCCNGDDND